MDDTRAPAKHSMISANAKRRYATKTPLPTGIPPHLCRGSAYSHIGDTISRHIKVTPEPRHGVSCKCRNWSPTRSAPLARLNGGVQHLSWHSSISFTLDEAKSVYLAEGGDTMPHVVTSKKDSPARCECSSVHTHLAGCSDLQFVRCCHPPDQQHTMPPRP